MKDKKKVSSKAAKQQRNTNDPIKSKVIKEKVTKSKPQPVVEQSPKDSVQTAPPGEPLVATKKTEKNSVPISDERSPSMPEIDDNFDDDWCKKVYAALKYRPSVLNIMLQDEKKHRPNRHYIRKQKYLTNRDRSNLIDWLVKVATNDDLDDETLYLAVSYADRYLSVDNVPKSYIKLLGAAVMYIAVKYEENDDAYEFLTGDNYGKNEVVIMEKIVLLTLSCDIRTPTACTFIFTYMEMCNMSEQLLQLTLYISELALTLMNGRTYMRFLPSKMAFASHALARHILGMEMWTPELEAVSTYKLYDIKNLARKLSLIHKSATNHIRQTTRLKFFSFAHHRVASIQAVVLTNEVLEKFTISYYAQQIQKSIEKEG